MRRSCRRCGALCLCPACHACVRLQLPVIAGMAAPFAPQGVHLDGPGSAGILPTLLPADWRTLAWGPLPMQGSIGGGA